eukprot:8768819-Pyramimonas_sp.AAC.2
MKACGRSERNSQSHRVNGQRKRFEEDMDSCHQPAWIVNGQPYSHRTHIQLVAQAEGGAPLAPHDTDQLPEPGAVVV